MQEQTLYSVLAADATIQGYIGTGSSRKLFSLRVPDEVEPDLIEFRRISGEAFNELNGYPCGSRAEFEIGCVSQTLATARAMREAVKSALGERYGFMDTEGEEYYADTKEFRCWLHWSLIE